MVVKCIMFVVGCGRLFCCSLIVASCLLRRVPRFLFVMCVLFSSLFVVCCFFLLVYVSCCVLHGVGCGS